MTYYGPAIYRAIFCGVINLKGYTVAHPLKEHSNLLASIERLLELGEKKSAALQQLRRLVLIADMLHLPIAKVEGVVSTYVSEPRTVGLHRWRGADLVILHENVEHRFPLVQAPLELWPPHLRTEYELHKKKSRRDRAGAQPDQY